MRETTAPVNTPATDIPAATNAPAPRLLDPTIWRDAALAWLSQRALLLLFAIVGSKSIDPHILFSRLFFDWVSWDGSIYYGIAQGGYRLLKQAAFYPLMPGLDGVVMVFTGSDQTGSGIAGLIVANVAALGAFGLLRVLVERELGRAVARRTLLYLVVFPTAFYFATPYAESLFLLVSVACFIALRRKRWLLAGVFAALAALARPVGILLIAPMLVEYLVDWRARGWQAPRVSERRELARLLAGVALPALAVAGFFLALTPVLGSFAPLRAELVTGWRRSLTAPGIGFARDAVALTTSDVYQTAHILLDGAFTLLFIALTIALWRRLPPAYIAYAWVTLLLVLMTPSHNWLALASNIRFMLVVFPLFMRLGQWGAKPRVNILILALSLPLLALLTVVYAIDGWVA